jgi:hypothetical protein
VRLTLEPGTRRRYSGGGITVEQMVIEARSQCGVSSRRVAKDFAK